MNYFTACERLATAKNRDKGKPIARNTRLFDRGDYIAIRYHNTDIVKFFNDGRITLHTGGWQTSSTKDRINTYTTANIYQHKYVWYVGSKVEPSGLFTYKHVKFVEGMEL